MTFQSTLASTDYSSNLQVCNQYHTQASIIQNLLDVFTCINFDPTADGSIR
jgi:hypothetical protein